MKFTLPERRAYYEDAQVRARLGEFFGGAFPEPATAVWFAPGTESISHYKTQHPLNEIEEWMDQGAELNRSLWDRTSLVAHLDIEYVNFDWPFEVYVDPKRAFELQRPVRDTVLHVLRRYGIRPLHVLTGRGHHFTWRITQECGAFGRLAEIGRMTESLEQLYASMPAPSGECVPPLLGRAFAGLGLVMEFLAHTIKREAAALTTIPVELGAIEVGPREHGREMISVDITEYADPLIARSIRAPFSVYLKPWQQPWLAHGTELDDLGPIISIPAGNLPEEEALHLMRDVEATRRLAATAHAHIPDFSNVMSHMIAGYEASQLRESHQWFYSAEHDPKESWPETYDRTDPTVLPTCVRFMLDQPNDSLLRPGCVERVVRVLLSLGWHPRHIGGLLRSKYERDYGWGQQWDLCDPATRADFYARLFSGLFLARTDDLMDFNCQSAREEGLCPHFDCNNDLTQYRKSLLNRRHYERLASRPFHGLFFPDSNP